MKKNEEKKNKRLTRENIKKIRIENIDKLEDVSLELQNSFKEIVYRQKEKYYFQIGFNRCATQSLYKAFIDCGLKAIHHNFKTTKLCFREYIATLMLDNLDKPKSLKKPILEHKLKMYDGFFDMTYIYDDYEFNFYTYFKNIERQYPGSIFIFNTRDCLSWILSRMKLGLSTTKYLLYYKNINEKKIKEWIDHYFEHSYLVRDYFLHKPIVKKRTNLYVYIIDKMSLSDFCKKIELPNSERIKDEKTDFIKNKKLSEDERKHITPEIIKYIQEKIDKFGDPSNYNWWK
jgi:hypothetical protein